MARSASTAATYARRDERGIPCQRELPIDIVYLRL